MKSTGDDSFQLLPMRLKRPFLGRFFVYVKIINLDCHRKK